ncbi:MAG: hypothetical protein JXA89_15280 [Anaerolineae bacterium]|nr:hypothetical protein [Anaerolineae bacterium]
MTIAIFALLFFGPERLPQMGAKLGQWLGKLTQQSKLFMYQWREEALAIHGAVEEVKGIRDEIMAARNEIAGTVTSAQSDISQSLDDVKGTLKNSQVTYEKMVKEAETEQRAKQPAQAGGEEEAIAKSQTILAGMQAKLGDVSLESGRARPQPTGSQEEEQAEMRGTEQLPRSGTAEPADKESQDVPDKPSQPGAHEQTQQILAAMQRKLSGEPEVPAVEETTPAESAGLAPLGDDSQVEPVETEVESPPEAPQMIPGSRVMMEKVEKRTGPSAHEQTQSILDRMQRKLAGEPVEDLAPPVVEEEKAAGQEPQDEWTKTHDLIQAALGSDRAKQPARQTPEMEPPTIHDVQVQEAIPANGTSEKIRELNDQVSTLQSEIKSLRQALDALRAEMLIKTALPARVPAGATPVGVTEERV